MKLILIPTNPRNAPRVAVTLPLDGYNIHEVIEQLVTPALIAYGFPPETVLDGYESALDEARPPAADTTTDAAAPRPPDGFEIVGFRLCDPAAKEYPDQDLAFSAGPSNSWHPTRWADGYAVWYAARVGSQAHTDLSSL